MLRPALTAGLIAALAACSPPASQDTRDTPQPTPPPTEIACNTVTPDATRQVSVDAPVVAMASTDLRGGSITPGIYDLSRAVRAGEATGWDGTRAVAVEVTEDAAGIVTLNWAGATPANVTDRWTGTLSETPTVRLTYTCGRVGEVEADFAAADRELQLRVADGANGALDLTFNRR